MWKMNSFMQRCLIIPVRLHAVSAAPYRNATNQRPEQEANCENNNGKCVLYMLNVMNGAGNYCTLCEARPCVRTYVRSSFIDFRDGRFTEGVIN